ncbi:MAG: hypothetical protein HRT69_02980 [Flavobacteriaceae bacterium]|nr:hypothetical protein [Flavobacteriaceae bacterium]
MKHILTGLIILLLCVSSCKTTYTAKQETSRTVAEKIQQVFPKSQITEIENLDGFKKTYQIALQQPLDHSDKSKGTFTHYIYLSHNDFSLPTVIETEGYQAYVRTKEMSKILRGNQVIVEYRFYGKSRPEPTPWKYLKYDQAIEDYHDIVTKLKKLYTGKWVSSGISKGGETVLIYKSKYPNDVDVAVPYVAPLINTQEDPRTTEHINTIGTAECRAKVTRFQRLLLENRASLLKEIRTYATEKGMKFTKVSVEEALEYAALEFSFSFWQWGAKCDDIPTDTASAKELFDYVNKVVGISFYNDKTFHRLLPSYYQHMIELGYYGFDFTPVKDLLKVVTSTSNNRFAPMNVDLTYNPNYIKKVRNYVENKGDQILYIYGEYDTWGACAPTPKTSVDALKMVLKGGAHSTRIKHFSPEDQQKIYAKLKKWLGMKVQINQL